MNTKQCIEKVREIVTPLVEYQNLVLWGIELTEGGKRCLRVYVESKDWEIALSKSAQNRNEINEIDGADEQDSSLRAAWCDLDQCETLARDLGVALDVEDLFPDAWVLEVSTPGLSRTFFNLSQMRPYVNDIVEVRVHSPLPGHGGRKFWCGKLCSVETDSFTIAPVQIDEDDRVVAEDPGRVMFDWGKVKRVNRRALFPRAEKPGKSSHCKK